MGGGAGREQNDKTEERGRRMRRKRVFEREKNEGRQRGGGVGGKEGPNGGGKRLRGTFKSAVSGGRRRGEGGERLDRRKK